MNFIKTRPNIEAMTPEEFTFFRLTPRVCTKCGKSKLTTDFSITTERGKKVVRSRCKVCMAEYYKTVGKRRSKFGARYKDPVSSNDRDNLRHARKLKATVTFAVRPHGRQFAVLRGLNGCKPKAVRIYEDEQAAEREAKRLSELFNAKDRGR